MSTLFLNDLIARVEMYLDVNERTGPWDWLIRRQTCDLYIANITQRGEQTELGPIRDFRPLSFPYRASTPHEALQGAYDLVQAHISSLPLGVEPILDGGMGPEEIDGGECP